MQRQPIHFCLLATSFVLLSIGSYPAAGSARAESPTAGSKPVASFDFRNVTKSGEGTISPDGMSFAVGKVTRVDSPFGCAAEFDGKGRISVKSDDLLNFNHAFSAAAWVNGSSARYRTMELAGMRSPNFQVVGDRVYFVTNSDPEVDSYDPPKKGKIRWNSVIW